MSDEQVIKKLQKEVTIFKKKLARSEANRITLEEIRDRNSNLFQVLNAEIEEQRQLVKEKNRQLEGVAKKLAKYLSPQVYGSIFSGERDVKIETYNKVLSLFFSDIVGFTPISEKMQANELAIWLNSYLNEMAKITLNYSGTLDKFIGDGVMVFFGDPNSNGEEADAYNCVCMAIEMREMAKSLGIDIRIGINTGECTVGNFGSDSRMDYTVVGGAVNLASRLESNGEAGKMLISDSTYQLIKNTVQCEERGTIKVKGISKDIMTYWVKKII